MKCTTCIFYGDKCISKYITSIVTKGAAESCRKLNMLMSEAAERKKGPPPHRGTDGPKKQLIEIK